MRLLLKSIIACIVVMSTFSPTARSIDVFVSLAAGDGSHFGKIDLSTYNFTDIPSLITGPYGSLAWSDSLSKFYMSQDQGNYLTTIDTSGNYGAQITGGTGRVMLGIAYDNTNSTLYGTRNVSPITYGTINTSTSAYTSSGSTTLSVPGQAQTSGRLTLMNNTAYLSVGVSGSGGLYSSSIGTAAKTLIGSNALYDDMTLASDGTTLYGLRSSTSSAIQIYSIDTSNAALTLLGTSNLGAGRNLIGAAIPTVPVPEPSTYALASIASGVMAAVARRRRAKPVK